MPTNDERRLSGDPPGRPEGANGHGGAIDRRDLANLALVFSDVAATLGALAIEFDGLAGAELARQALALDAELSITEANVGDTRRFLRDLAKAAMP